MDNMEYGKKYYLEHKDYYNQYGKKYYQEHKDYFKAQHDIYYQKNKESVLRRGNQYNRKVKEDWEEYIKSLGLGICRCCGYDKYFEVIDFHHENPSEKDVDISRIYHGKSLTEQRKELFRKEIEKCIPLCCRCHREIHIEGRKNGTKLV